MNRVKKQSGLEVLESRLLEMILKYRMLQREANDLRVQVSEANAEPEVQSDGRDEVLAEKDDVIRRLQAVIKKKEESFDELQEAFQTQKKLIEKLSSEKSEIKKNTSSNQEGNSELRAKLESALQKLNDLEALLN